MKGKRKTSPKNTTMLSECRSLLGDVVVVEEIEGKNSKAIEQNGERNEKNGNRNANSND